MPFRDVMMIGVGDNNKIYENAMSDFFQSVFAAMQHKFLLCSTIIAVAGTLSDWPLVFIISFPASQKHFVFPCYSVFSVSMIYKKL
jgi:hypothetical protein